MYYQLYSTLTSPPTSLFAAAAAGALGHSRNSYNNKQLSSWNSCGLVRFRHKNYFWVKTSTSLRLDGLCLRGYNNTLMINGWLWKRSWLKETRANQSNQQQCVSKSYDSLHLTVWLLICVAVKGSPVLGDGAFPQGDSGSSQNLCSWVWYDAIYSIVPVGKLVLDSGSKSIMCTISLTLKVIL